MLLEGCVRRQENDPVAASSFNLVMVTRGAPTASIKAKPNSPPTSFCCASASKFSQISLWAEHAACGVDHGFGRFRP